MSDRTKIIITTMWLSSLMFVWAVSYHFDKKLMGTFSYYFTAVACGLFGTIALYTIWGKR